MSPTFTDHREHPIAWRESGSGRPVVFLHGLGGSRLAWGPQLRVLSSAMRCIAWDMPGYGDSAPVEPLTFAAIAARLVGLLDRLEIERADLVGLSFGGMQALHLAIEHPGRVDRLVLVDTSPAFGMDGTEPDAWRRTRLAALDAGRAPADFAPDVLDAIVGRPLDPTLRSELIEAFAAVGADAFRAAVHCLPTHDVRPRLGAIAHRALVLVGELDRETPPAYSRVLADGLQDAELVVLPGVGHLSPSEDPDGFNHHVARFLGRTETDRA